MRKLSLFIFLFSLFAAVFFYENMSWVRETCATYENGMCYKRFDGDRPKRYWSLDACISDNVNEAKDFICASGPNADMPHNSMHSSFRKVYHQLDNSFVEREVEYSFSFQIISLTVGAILLAVVLAVKVVAKVIWKTKD